MAPFVRLDHKVLLLIIINLSASSIVCFMDMITSMLKLCELSTDHGTSSEYTEGPGVAYQEYMLHLLKISSRNYFLMKF